MSLLHFVHHRAALEGCAAPPNSLNAIEACLNAQAPMLEIDITALAEDDYAILHYPLLDSETTGNGLVGDSTPSHIKTQFLRHEGQTSPHRVALLSEVVQLVSQHPNQQTRLQLDFKNLIPFTDDEPLRRLVNLLEPIGDRVIVTSLADWQLRRLSNMAHWLDVGFDIHLYLNWSPPDEPAGWPYPRERGAYGYWDDHPLAQHRYWSTPQYLMDRCDALLGLLPDALTFYLNQRCFLRSLEEGFNWASALHEVGIHCDVYTLNSQHPDALSITRQLIEAGVDFITTDTPLSLAAALQAGQQSSDFQVSAIMLDG